MKISVFNSTTTELNNELLFCASKDGTIVLPLKVFAGALHQYLQITTATIPMDISGSSYLLRQSAHEEDAVHLINYFVFYSHALTFEVTEEESKLDFLVFAAELEKVFNSAKTK